MYNLFFLASVLPYPDGVIGIEILLLLLIAAMEMARIFWGKRIPDFDHAIVTERLARAF